MGLIDPFSKPGRKGRLTPAELFRKINLCHEHGEGYLSIFIAEQEFILHLKTFPLTILETFKCNNSKLFLVNSV